MKTKTLLKISVVLMLIFVQISFSYYAPPDGGSGTWVWFRYTVHVTDPSNVPLPNVHVEMTANYSLKMGLQWQDQVVFVSGVTDANGNVTLVKAVDVTNYWPDNYIFIDMSVKLTEPGFSVLSSQATYTHFPNGSASFVTIHDEDSNGIPDLMELPLAMKFSPIFKFHQNNILFPTPIEAVYGNNNIILKNNSSQYIPLPITVHNGQEWRTYFINTIEPKISPNIDANGLHPTIYAHSFSKNYSDYYGNSKNYYIIQYWMYYPFNDAANVHEGDWEHVDLIVDSFDPNTALPVGIIYYHHNTSTPYLWNQISNVNNHPYVFVGGRQILSILFGSTKSRNGHEVTGASYPSQGWHYLVDFPKTLSEGLVDGVSLWIADEEVVSDSRILNYDEYKILNVSMAHPLWWMGYSGKWGADPQTVKNDTFHDSFGIHINVPHLFVNLELTWPLFSEPPVGPPFHKKWGKIDMPQSPISINIQGPFSSTVNLKYSLLASSEINIRIVDVRGGIVKTFNLGIQDIGEHIFSWNWININGKKVAYGDYVMKIEVSPNNIFHYHIYYQ